jgi:hypothetical protein
MLYFRNFNFHKFYCLASYRQLLGFSPLWKPVVKPVVCMTNLNNDWHCISMWACFLQPTVYRHPIKEIPLSYRSTDWEPKGPKTLSVVAGRGEEKEWRKRGRKDGILLCLERNLRLLHEDTLPLPKTRYHYRRHDTITEDTIPLPKTRYHYRRDDTITEDTMPLPKTRYHYRRHDVITEETIPLSNTRCHYRRHDTITEDTMPLPKTRYHYRRHDVITEDMIPLPKSCFFRSGSVSWLVYSACRVNC